MVGQLWQRWSGATVGPFVQHLSTWAPLAKGIRQVMADPEGALQPMVAAIASKLETEVPGKVPEVIREQIGNVGGGASRGTAASGGGVVQRQIDPALVMRQPA